jgi:hypothetical protein
MWVLFARWDWHRGWRNGVRYELDGLGRRNVPPAFPVQNEKSYFAHGNRRVVRELFGEFVDVSSDV